MTCDVHISTTRYSLELTDPFAIAHGTTHIRTTVVLQIHAGEHVGYGEAPVVPYYEETAADIEDGRINLPLRVGHLDQKVPRISGISMRMKVYKRIIQIGEQIIVSSPYGSYT